MSDNPDESGRFDLKLFIVVDRQHYCELRYWAIGRADDQILSVAYLMQAEVYRIISARKASRNERKHYRAVSTGSKARGRSAQTCVHPPQSCLTQSP